jgi:hypothetical protein
MHSPPTPQSHMENTEERNSLVIGSARTPAHVHSLIEALKKAGFSPQDLAVIAPGDDLKQDTRIALDHKPGNDPADEKPREGSDKLRGMVVGALLGGMALGTVGGVIGLVSFEIPRLSLITFTSLLAAIFTYAGIGAAAGVIAGGMIGLRAPDHFIKQHEIDKRAGRTLITVHAQTPEASQKAMTVLLTGGAEEVYKKVNEGALHN